MDEHILIGLSSAPCNAKVIRTAAAMAAAFGCRFTALFVRTPKSMNEADREQLRLNTELAQNLGATVETVLGDDVPHQLAEYARLSKVTKIVIGHSKSRKYPWSKPTTAERLSAISPDIDVHVIPDAAAEGSYRAKKVKEKLPKGKLFRDLSVVAGILLLATLIGHIFSRFGFTEANIITVYLLAVPLASSITSSRSGYVLAAVGSVLLFSYLFSGPIFSFKVYAQGYPITCVLLLLTAVGVGALTDRQAKHSKQAAQAAYRTNLLLETNQLLQKTQSDSGVLQVTQMQVSKLLERDVTVRRGSVGRVKKDSLLYPLKVQDRIYGTVLIDGSAPVEAFENSVLLSILGECALALENSRNAREKEESKLQAENEKLRANLLRSISHDLRTPLTSISGNAGILLSGDKKLDSETRKQIYTDIYDDAAFLYNLVENLLAVTKIENGRMELKTQHHLLEEIVSEAMLHVKKTEHVITVTHENDLLLAKCDAKLIVQVLINLVDNAIKYTPEGSHIQVCTRAESSMAVISVSDDGYGISDAEKGKIFQMFYTGSSAIADSRRSLGLGLGLCKSIVEAHGGTICVSDNVPHGAIFSFTLPAREVELHE